jgi:signal transduction histidine kinase
MTLHDVTRQKKAEEDMQRALSARDDVLAFVSHDLRNPLNNIYLAAQLLRETVEPGSFEEKPVTSIMRGVKKAERLIQDLLDVSSTESGRLKLERSPEDPGTLVQQAVEDHMAQAAERSVRLEVDESPGLPEVPVDRARVLRVLGNLLSNAIRFTPEDGRVTLSATASNEGVEMCVADTGPGIDEADLAHVFDRYWQARRQGRSGAGLGLAIAKGIVQSHGGRIWVESTVGEGSRFKFVLPLKPRQRAAS